MKDQTTQKMYFVNGNLKREIINTETFDYMSLDASKIEEVASSTLSSYQTGTQLNKDFITSNPSLVVTNQLVSSETGRCY